MHDTVCHAWSTAHEYPILTPSITTEDAQDHKDMRKRVSARSTRLPLSALCIVNCSDRTTENSMTISRSHDKTPPPTHQGRRARLPLLLAAGRVQLQHLLLEVNEGLHVYAGLQ